MENSIAETSKQNIELALQSWDFEKAYNLYQQNLTESLKMEFCLFLKDIGNIEALWCFLESNCNSNITPPPPHYHVQTFGILKY